MTLDVPLMFFLAVMLYARIAAGRAVPLSAFAVTGATWGLLLIAQLSAQVVGSLTRIAGYDPSGYYMGPVMELYSLTASAAHLVLGAIIIAAVLFTAAMTPLPATTTPAAE